MALREDAAFRAVLERLRAAGILGHEIHQETPSFRAVSRFLGVRYRYWSDDIEHDDPFAASLSVGGS